MVRLPRDLTDRKEVNVNVTTATFIRLALMSVATIVILLSIRRAAHALLLIFTAIFLALALNSPVHWLGQKLPGSKRGSRALATTISFLIVIILLGGFLASIMPPLVRQTENFVVVAPRLVRDFRSQDSVTGKFIREHKLEKQVNTFSNQLSERLKNVGGTAFSTAQKIGGSVFSLLTIIVLTFMMLVEGPRWIAFAREVVPDKHHGMTDRLSREMYSVIKGYINGQVVLAAIAALLIMPVVLLLHISYPVALFVIIFVCGLIPMVGHTIGAIIVTTVALFTSLGAAVIVLAYYILYQQIENYFVQPRIQANTTNMSPLLVFMSVVVGVSFGGLFGALVAIPLVGCLRIAVLEYLRSSGVIDSAQFDEFTGDSK